MGYPSWVCAPGHHDPPPDDSGATGLGPAVISLNVRGLRGKTDKVKALYTSRYCDFLLLQETDIKQHHVDNITHKLGLGREHTFFSHSDNRCNGTGIIQTSNRWEVMNSHSGLEGRVTGVNIKDNNGNFSIVSVYAPSGSSNTEKRDFFSKLCRWVATHMSYSLILGGDFNCTLEEKDIRGIRSGVRRAGRIELGHLIRHFHLTDTYRHLHPDGTATTFDSRHNTSARLDRIYTQNNINIQYIEHLHHTTRGPKNLLIIAGFM